MAQSKDMNISPEVIAEAVKRAMAALGQGSAQGAANRTQDTFGYGFCIALPV